MTEDHEGFLALENDTDALEGAERVMAFARVRRLEGRENHIPITCLREEVKALCTHKHLDMVIMPPLLLPTGSIGVREDGQDGAQRRAHVGEDRAPHRHRGYWADRDQAAQVQCLRGHNEHRL